MANLKYWESIAAFALPLDESKYTGNIPLTEIDQAIAGTFEKGLALMMINDVDHGLKYMEICKLLVDGKGTRKKDKIYYLYEYFLTWIYTHQLEQKILNDLISIKWDEILDEVIRLEVWDVYNICMKASMGRMKREQNIQRMGLKKSKKNKYPYEVAADHLIEVAKYLLLNNNNRGARLAVEGAQKLYSQALQLIPKMLSRRNRKWKEVEDKSDVQIKKDYPDGNFDYYLEERDKLRGNIPLYRWQGEVLLHLEKYMGGTTEVKQVQQKIDDFFKEIINPKDIMSSLLYLNDEILWTMLKLKFEQKSFKVSLYQVPIDYLRTNLT